MKFVEWAEVDHCLELLGWRTAAVVGVMALSALYFAVRKRDRQLPKALHDQSFVEPGPEGIRVPKFYVEQGKYLSYFDPNVRTLYESFRHGAKQTTTGRCLGWREGPERPYQWLPYDRVLSRARNLGAGLLTLGLHPGSLVGIYCQNRPEWIITELGCYSFSLVVVPLYDTLGPDACSSVIQEAELKVVIVDDDARANVLLDQAPQVLRYLIAIKVEPDTKERARARGVEILTLEEAERLGAVNTKADVPPKPTDLCTVCYTSGTSGRPKGVMLTHANAIASVCAVSLQLGDYRPTRDDVLISFLPLAHMLERCCEHGLYMVGGAVGFFSGDIKRLPQDLQALRPTMMPVVPRLLNRIYDQVKYEISSSYFKRILFNLALKAKEAELKKGIVRKDSIWDRLIFRKIQDRMGGQLRCMMVAAAPIAGSILSFTRCALGCHVAVGYGQTECCAPISVTVQGDFVPDHVGPPVACCSVKLVDVPQMKYYAINNEGEVCVKGTNIFLGYYKDEDMTRQAIDNDGWLHTGDVGTWLPNGTLKIIDRKENIFKLSQGEYIVPERIQNTYMNSQYVQQVFVYGEPLKSNLVAVVVPQFCNVLKWTEQNNISGSLPVLCKHPKVKQQIFKDMVATGIDGGLKSFEQVKEIFLHPDPFSVENGLLSPTLKSKRTRLKETFKTQIEDMYARLEDTPEQK